MSRKSLVSFGLSLTALSLLESIGLFACSATSSPNGNAAASQDASVLPSTDSGISQSEGETGASDSGAVDSRPLEDTGSAGDAGLDGTANAPVVGLVTLEQNTSDDGILYALFAEFVPPSDVIMPGSCPSPGVAMGACCFTGPPGATSTTYYGAGNVYVLGPSTSAMLATVTQLNGIYLAENTTSPALLWTPGDVLGVGATGGAGVGAFTSPAPTSSELMGLSPAIVTGMTIDTSMDFTLTWSPDTLTGVDEIVQLVLESSTASGPDGTIACLANDSMGGVGLTVPAALFATAGWNSTEAMSGHVERSVVTTATAPNATVYVMGAVVVVATGSFK